MRWTLQPVIVPISCTMRWASNTAEEYPVRDVRRVGWQVLS